MSTSHVATESESSMKAFTNCDNAVGYALRMAARGQRPWCVRYFTVWSHWGAVPHPDEGTPNIFGSDTRAADVCNVTAPPESQLLICYPTGLVLPLDLVNWVWWIVEERTYRQGSAVQAQKYAVRKGYESPICVDPSYMHGSQVREDRDRGYVFLPSLSFPSWTQERYQ